MTTQERTDDGRSEFEPGDRVQDVCWDGRYLGTVKRVDENGDLCVRWDHHRAEYQVSPNQVVRLAPSEVPV